VGGRKGQSINHRQFNLVQLRSCGTWECREWGGGKNPLEEGKIENRKKGGRPRNITLVEGEVRGHKSWAEKEVFGKERTSEKGKEATLSDQSLPGAKWERHRAT